jgi:alpha-ketoglutarate-dependent taurine dioxygenase
MSIDVKPIKPHIGAIINVDRTALGDEAVVKQCLALLEDRGVLVFPGLGLSDKEQLAFTDRLGTRVNYVRSERGRMADEADVYKVTLDRKLNNAPEYVLGTFFWHMDGITSDIPPPKATVLTARKLAPKGGQTEFASTFAGYENLSVADKADIANLRAVHSVEASLRPLYTTPTDEDRARWVKLSPKEHPIVWTQGSGRKSLVIGSTADYVAGMPIPEGRALLTRLLEWTVQPDFSYRHEWQDGDLVIWNNCGVVHRVIPYDRDSGRAMHRTSIAGVERVQ